MLAQEIGNKRITPFELISGRQMPLCDCNPVYGIPEAYRDAMTEENIINSLV